MQSSPWKAKPTIELNQQCSCTTTISVLCFAGWLSECTASQTAQNNTPWSNVEYFHHRVCIFLLQGFAESLQHDSSNQSEIVMIKLYCCGPDYCSIYPLLYYFFQIRNGLGSSVFKLCCKDSAKPCMWCAVYVHFAACSLTTNLQSTI